MFRLLFILQAFVLAIDLRTLLHHQSNLGNVVQKLLLLLTGVAFLIKNPVQPRVLALIAAIAAVTFICALGTEYREFEWRLYLGGLVSIVVPFILLGARPAPQDRLLGLKVFAALPVLMVVIGCIYAIAGISPLFIRDATGALRLSASQEAAFLGGAAFVGAFSSLELAENRHAGYLTLLALDFIIVILTGSRMAIALTLMVCGIDFLRSFARFPLIKWFAPAYFLLAATIYLAFFGENILKRFQSHTMSGRNLLWAALGRQLEAHPWFGVGLGNQQQLVPSSLRQQTTTIAAHNEYLRLAVELGYPGAIAVFLLSLGIFYVVWRSAWIQRNPMFVVCTAAFYIYCITDNVWSGPQYFFIMVAAAFACEPRSTAEARSVSGPRLTGTPALTSRI